MKKIWSKIVQNPLLQSFLHFYKSAESDLTGIAVAYYFLISIFPILLILANLLPYFNIDASQVLNFLEDVLPTQFYQTIKDVTENILNTPSSGLLSLSILSALWTFSQVFTMLQKAFNKAYGVTDHRNVVLGRLLGLVVGVVLQLILTLTIFLNLFGNLLIKLLQTYLKFDNSILESLLEFTQPAAILSLVVTLMLIYLSLPNIRISKIRYVFPGTIFVAFTLITSSNLIGTYVDLSLSKMNDLKLVGTLFIFGMMTWFILLAKLLIWGAVLNATYQHAVEGKFETRSPFIFNFFRKKI